ncbi:GNAT family N-acetyltransferase [Paenibacillus sp. MSJ-34]|nr:GNAT family protein [Paenibacillus sp. MSJ-34]MBU5445131.1 GNAT family N-acetyltransferase [Paenibacillus sp. MSJ-34]
MMKMYDSERNIYVRSLRPDDAPALTELRLKNREHLQPFEPLRDPDFFTLETQTRLLEKGANDEINDLAYTFGVFTADDQRLVGRLALTNVVRGPGQYADLGYFIDPDFGGKGYTTAAVRMIAKYAFTELRLHRIQAGAMPRNIASQRVLEKAGFIAEGISRKLVQINGKWEDHRMYALLAEDLDLDSQRA